MCFLQNSFGSHSTLASSLIHKLVLKKFKAFVPFFINQWPRLVTVVEPKHGNVQNDHLVKISYMVILVKASPYTNDRYYSKWSLQYILDLTFFLV